MSRSLNENFTMAMDPRTMQTALSKKLDESTIATLAAHMEPEETLNDYLTKGGRRAAAFVDALEKAEIFDKRNKSAYFKSGTKLNEDGKALAERIIVGKLVDDADTLGNMRPSLYAAVSRAAPYLYQAEAHGADFNLRGSLRNAVSAYNTMVDAKDNGSLGALPDAESNRVQFREAVGTTLDDMFHGKHAVLGDERGMVLLELLLRHGGPNQIGGVFRNYATMAAQNSRVQSGMDRPGPQLSAEEIFDSAVRKVVSAKAAAAEDRVSRAADKRRAKDAEEAKAPETEQAGLALAHDAPDWIPSDWSTADTLRALAKGMRPNHKYISREGPFADGSYRYTYPGEEHEERHAPSRAPEPQQMGLFGGGGKPSTADLMRQAAKPKPPQSDDLGPLFGGRGDTEKQTSLVGAQTEAQRMAVHINTKRAELSRATAAADRFDKKTGKWPSKAALEGYVRALESESAGLRRLAQIDAQHKAGMGSVLDRQLKVAEANMAGAKRHQDAALWAKALPAPVSLTAAAMLAYANA
jgi:hypothetical protein